MDPFRRNRQWQRPELIASLTTAKAIVGGMGGTGWAVGGHLVGLGVTNLIVFDPDRLEDSNLNRMWGCTLADVGAPKADVFSALARNTSPMCTVRAFTERVPSQAFETELQGADVVFGCFDSPEPRIATQVLAMMYDVVYIDVGTSLWVTDGKYGGQGQAYVYRSRNDACILCAGLTMQSPGYRVASVEAPMPSSGALNAVVASAGVSAWLRILQGLQYAPKMWFDWDTSTMAAVPVEKRDDCPLCSRSLPGRDYLDEFIRTLTE